MIVSVDGSVLLSTSSESSSVWRFMVPASAYLPCLLSTNARLLMIVSVSGCALPSLLSLIASRACCRPLAAWNWPAPALTRWTPRGVDGTSRGRAVSGYSDAGNERLRNAGHAGTAAAGGLHHRVRSVCLQAFEVNSIDYLLKPVEERAPGAGAGQSGEAAGIRRAARRMEAVMEKLAGALGKEPAEGFRSASHRDWAIGYTSWTCPV